MEEFLGAIRPIVERMGQETQLRGKATLGYRLGKKGESTLIFWKHKEVRKGTLWRL